MPALSSPYRRVRHLKVPPYHVNRPGGKRRRPSATPAVLVLELILRGPRTTGRRLPGRGRDCRSGGRVIPPAGTSGEPERPSQRPNGAAGKYWLTLVTETCCCNVHGGILREGQECVYRHTPREILCIRCAELRAISCARRASPPQPGRRRCRPATPSGAAIEGGPLRRIESLCQAIRRRVLGLVLALDDDGDLGAGHGQTVLGIPWRWSAPESRSSSPPAAVRRR